MTGVELALLAMGIGMGVTAGLTWRRTHSNAAVALVVAAWIAAAWYAGLIV